MEWVLVVDKLNKLDCEAIVPEQGSVTTDKQ